MKQQGGTWRSKACVDKGAMVPLLRHLRRERDETPKWESALLIGRRVWSRSRATVTDAFPNGTRFQVVSRLQETKQNR